jgi:hypothetical protein
MLGGMARSCLAKVALLTMVVATGEAKAAPDGPSTPRFAVGAALAVPVPAVTLAEPVTLARRKPDPWGRPRTIDYEEGDPVPYGYVIEEKRRLGPLIAGASTFGIAYMFSVGIAALDMMLPYADDPTHSAWPLFIPVAGPFVTIMNARETWIKTFLIIDGAMQAVGVTLLSYGLASKKQVLVLQGADLRVVPMPMVAADRVGLGFVGAF